MNVNDYEKFYYKKAEEKGGFDYGWRKYILDFIKANTLDRATVLELGCGEGVFAKKFSDNVSYCGVDASAFAVDSANKKNIVADGKFKLIDPDDDELPFGDKYFDFVFGVYSLEHFKKPRKMLDEAVRVLKPKGHLILLAPNLEFPFARINAVRHKSFLYKKWLCVARIYDYSMRIFGVSKFRTVEENFTSATGKYEKLDDDLTYIVSSFEVINYLKKKYFLKEIFSCKMDKNEKIGKIKGSIKRFVALLPAMKYYGNVLFVIMQKHLE